MGTPDIVGAIKVWTHLSTQRERRASSHSRCRRIVYPASTIQIWSDHPNIQILGNPNSWRLSIVSFMIRDGEQYLHHNFVVAVLNDLFGIQASEGDVLVLDRMGTACWGLI